jgi:hypothetical protein
MKNKIKDILATIAVVTVGIILAAFVFYGILFVIPTQIGECNASLKEWAIAFIMVLGGFSVIAAFQWGLRRLSNKNHTHQTN